MKTKKEKKTILALINLTLYIGQFSITMLNKYPYPKYSIIQLVCRYHSRRYPLDKAHLSHTELITTLLRTYNTNEELIKKKWRFITSVTRSTLSEFGHNFDGAINLRRLLGLTHVKQEKEPFQLILLTSKEIKAIQKRKGSVKAIK